MVEGAVAGEMRGEEMDGGEVVVVTEGEAGKGRVLVEVRMAQNWEGGWGWAGMIPLVDCSLLYHSKFLIGLSLHCRILTTRLEHHVNPLVLLARELGLGL